MSTMTSTPHVPSTSSLPQCHWRIRFLLVLLLALVSLPTTTMALSGFGTSFFAFPRDSANISGSRSSSTTTNGMEDSQQQPIKVLVTGAAGKTGRLILKKLEQDPRYEPKALVRSEASARSLVKDPDISCPLEHIAISDITSPTFAEDLPSGLDHGYYSYYLAGRGRERARGTAPATAASAMIICTSAVPQITRRSLAAALVKVPWNVLRRKKQMIDYRSIKFKWKHDGYPEKVDYHGTVAQINLAKKLGIQKVVLVSSMGGTDPSCFLNNVGKNKDGTGHGDILQWKRLAEKYLVESGLDHTIIHPGGLVDTPGGKEEFVLDVDDNLIRSHARTRISREDVAELCVAALTLGKGQNISFDCITLEPNDNNNNSKCNDKQTNGESRPKTAKDALSAFVALSKTANYAI